MTEPKEVSADKPLRTRHTSFDGIIPTGWLTAYGRTFSDIPYAQAMFDELESIRVASGATETFELMKDTQLAPQFEARHKLLGKLIKQTGIAQILEVAAGLSTRGVEMASDPVVKYVEIDLPAMMADKRAIMSDMVQKGSLPHRSNLHLEDGSAIELEALLWATRHFDEHRPIVVVNEGLLRYLSLEAKTTYAENVKALLREFGGAWITSDISLPRVMYKDNDVMVERRKRISRITGVNVADNLFKDEEDAKHFFNELGFDIESHSFLEVIDELSSPARLDMPRDYVEAINGSAVVFVMTLKNQ